MKLQEKKRDRPYIPGYGIEKSDKGLLDWDFVQENMKNARNYWISTSSLDCQPHAIPVWGSWIDNDFFFGSGSDTKNQKNLAHNPCIIVHSESGMKVVIIEGKVSIEKDEEKIIRIKKDYLRKYKIDHPPPFFRVNKIKVICWDMNDYQGTPTRWKFKYLIE